jgi:CheY-like chemotaxis protein
MPEDVVRRTSGTRPRPGRILIVDDEVLVCRALRLWLCVENDVSLETSALAAIQRIESGERFDMILCDVSMPEMNGIEFYRRIEAIAPEQAERFVFISGGLLDPRQHKFFDTIPNPCLEKPPDVAHLQSLVRDRLAKAG